MRVPSQPACTFTAAPHPAGQPGGSRLQTPFCCPRSRNKQTVAGRHSLTHEPPPTPPRHRSHRCLYHARRPHPLSLHAPPLPSVCPSPVMSNAPMFHKCRNRAVRRRIKGSERAAPRGRGGPPIIQRVVGVRGLPGGRQQQPSALGARLGSIRAGRGGNTQTKAAWREAAREEGGARVTGIRAVCCIAGAAAALSGAARARTSTNN